jgi:hypothetical protein
MFRRAHAIAVEALNQSVSVTVRARHFSTSGMELINIDDNPLPGLLRELLADRYKA